MAQCAALAALSDDEHVANSRAVNQADMEQVVNGLTALGFDAIPSEANFVYFNVGEMVDKYSICCCVKALLSVISKGA